MAEPRLYLRLQSRHVDRTGKRGRKRRRRRRREDDRGSQSPVKTRRLSPTILPSIYMTKAILKQAGQWIIKWKAKQNPEIVTGKCSKSITNTGGSAWMWGGVKMEDKASRRQAPLRKTAQSKLRLYAENFGNV